MSFKIRTVVCVLVRRIYVPELRFAQDWFLNVFVLLLFLFFFVFVFFKTTTTSNAGTRSAEAFSATRTGRSDSVVVVLAVLVLVVLVRLVVVVLLLLLLLLLRVLTATASTANLILSFVSSSLSSWCARRTECACGNPRRPCDTTGGNKGEREREIHTRDDRKRKASAKITRGTFGMERKGNQTQDKEQKSRRGARRESNNGEKMYGQHVVINKRSSSA